MLIIRAFVIVLSLFILSGCGGQKIVNISQPVKKVKVSRSQMQNAIIDAANKSGWELSKVSDGHLIAQYNTSKHMAKADVEYSSNFYNIHYLESKNLQKSGNSIDENYNNWIKAFNKHIHANLKGLEKGRFVASSSKEIKQSSNAVAISSSLALGTVFSYKESDTIRENDFALIIGISDYKKGPDVEFANNSALAFKELVHTTFGLPNENIITLIDDDASSGTIKSNLYLIKELAEKDSRIYFYFAGHGLPSRSGETSILPYDMSAAAMEVETQLRLDNIYALLAKSSAKEIFVVLDSCFSGKDDKGKLLYKGVAPVLKVKRAEPKKRMTIFTAGGSGDFANDYQSKQQRLFTYYFINAINEGKKTSEDIYNYTKLKVKRESLHKGLIYKQVPTMAGNSKSEIY